MTDREERADLAAGDPAIRPETHPLRALAAGSLTVMPLAREVH